MRRTLAPVLLAMLLMSFAFVVWGTLVTFTVAGAWLWASAGVACPFALKRSSVSPYVSRIFLNRETSTDKSTATSSPGMGLTAFMAEAAEASATKRSHTRRFSSRKSLE